MKEKTPQPEKPFGKTKDPIQNAILTLAYRCLQWEDGEIKGFDMQMMESLLPIIMKPNRVEPEKTDVPKEQSELIKKLKEKEKQLDADMRSHRVEPNSHELKMEFVLKELANLRAKLSALEMADNIMLKDLRAELEQRKLEYADMDREALHFRTIYNEVKAERDKLKTINDQLKHELAAYKNQERQRHESKK